MSKKNKHYGMVIDLRRCIGCHACTIACKMENATPKDKFKTWVEEWDSGDYPNTTRAKLPKLCNHCNDAPCIPVCPVEATYQTPEGVVVVDEEKCIGCNACVTECPYDARYLDNGKAGKCMYCIHRVAAGLMPACVSSCVSHARFFGDLNDPESEVSKLIAENDCDILMEELGLDVSVYYIGLKETLKDYNPDKVFIGVKK